MHSDGAGVHPLVQGFRYPAGVAWSPDTRWLVFPAAFDTFFHREQGLWLVEVATGKRQLLASGENFTGPVWSPDGQRVAVIQRTGQYSTFERQVVIVEVGPLLTRK